MVVSDEFLINICTSVSEEFSLDDRNFNVIHHDTRNYALSVARLAVVGITDVKNVAMTYFP